MKMKSATITLVAIAIVGIATLTPTHAAPPPGFNLYARTDRPTYAPGDTGTLFITVRNQGTNAFTIKNITVTYPWKFFITDHWDGNFTTVLSTAPARARSSARTVASALYPIGESRRSRVQIPPGPHSCLS